MLAWGGKMEKKNIQCQVQLQVCIRGIEPPMELWKQTNSKQCNEAMARRAARHTSMGYL